MDKRDLRQFPKVTSAELRPFGGKIRLKYLLEISQELQRPMSEETVSVNKRGQFTIPKRFRKDLRIEEGSKLLVIEEESSLVIKRLPEMDDLLGLHAGKNFYIELQFELDKMRKQDRY